MAASGTGFGVSTPGDELLVAYLDRIVPLLAADLRALSDTERHEVARAWTAAAVAPIAEGGDTLRFGGKEAAEVFIHVARGLAALASCPGGVMFAGQSWAADRRPVAERAA